MRSGSMRALGEREFKPNDRETQLLIVYSDIRRQEILGFGGALTPASADVYRRMDDGGRKRFMDLLYGEQGLGYTLGRVSVAGCDFAPEGSRSYCDTPGSLDHFSVAHDEASILPFIRKALARSPSLRLLASPWSPPAWMKDSANMLEGGKLKEDMYDLYSDYLLLFLKAYAERGAPVDFLTVQNEPLAVQRFESCVYRPEDEARMITEFLGPKLRREGLSTSIWIWDHNKERVYARARAVLAGIAPEDPVSAVAFHWYSGAYFENLALCREFFPDKQLIFTEGCEGRDGGLFSSASFDDAVKHERAWQTAEHYGAEIIGNLNAGMNGFIDWNVLLDETGGPNHVGNFCAAPIIYNAREKQLLLQPSYHYISHFSRFLPRGSRIAATARFSENVSFTAAVIPGNEVVCVSMNAGHSPVTAYIQDERSGLMLELALPARSLTTVVYRQ
jgi:glucosylceramidase